MSDDAVLYGLFIRLRQQGMRLAVRDYLDGLRALRLGFGVSSRGNLQQLCTALWVRTDEDRRRLALMFAELETPTDEDVQRLIGAAPTGQSNRPTKNTGPHRQESFAQPSPQKGRSEESRSVTFDRPGGDGIALPRSNIRLDCPESFVLTPPAIVDSRSLVVAWRRMWIARRTGPRTELDIQATISTLTHRGGLVEPRLVAPRRNLASLTILIDASRSMAPWLDVIPHFETSLRQSRLAKSAIYYFDNVPSSQLFQTSRLTSPVPLQEVLFLHSGSPVLVFSDGGAARGRITRQRIIGTRDFIKNAKARLYPFAWINPVPRNRWPSTSFEQIGHLSGLSTFELTEEGLIQAVDVLRGKREVRR